MNAAKRFIKNITQPKQTIVFRFQRLSQAIGYVFFITLIFTAILSQHVLHNTFWSGHQHLSYIFVPIILVFYYVLFIGVIFIGITLLAGLGILIKSTSQRKINFQQLWIITSNAITIPSIILVLFDVVIHLPTYSFFIYGFICLLILTYMIFSVPKPKKKQP